MRILKEQPEAKESCVERVSPPRYAENGDFDKTFQSFSDRTAASVH